jgi:hypothetical protein
MQEKGQHSGSDQTIQTLEVKDVVGTTEQLSDIPDKTGQAEDVTEQPPSS